jgi:hypothetical protein
MYIIRIFVVDFNLGLIKRRAIANRQLLVFRLEEKNENIFKKGNEII